MRLSRGQTAIRARQDLLACLLVSGAGQLWAASLGSGHLPFFGVQVKSAIHNTRNWRAALKPSSSLLMRTEECGLCALIRPDSSLSPFLSGSVVSKGTPKGAHRKRQDVYHDYAGLRLRLLHLPPGV